MECKQHIYVIKKRFDKKMDVLLRTGLNCYKIVNINFSVREGITDSTYLDISNFPFLGGMVTDLLISLPSR